MAILIGSSLFYRLSYSSLNFLIAWLLSLLSLMQRLAR